MSERESSVVVLARASYDVFVLPRAGSRLDGRNEGRNPRSFFRGCENGAVAEFSKATVNSYRASLEQKRLSSSIINQRLSAIRKLAMEAADNGHMPLDRASAISRAKGTRQAGVRIGHWLTSEQAERLFSAPDTTTPGGVRDRALLSALIGGGLRCREATTLSVEHIQLRDSRWVIADLIGKGKRARSVPMLRWTRQAIEAWLAVVRRDLTDAPCYHFGIVIEVSL